MVYLPTGNWDLIPILGCMTYNVLYLSFAISYSSPLWRTDTIVFSKLNRPPSQISPQPLLSPASNGFEINKLQGGLVEDLRYPLSRDETFVHY